MSRIARLIIYEAPDDQLAKQLGGSMAEGIHYKGQTKITIIKLSSEPILNGFIDETTENLNIIFGPDQNV